MTKGSPESRDPVTVVSWNVGKRQEPWRQLVNMDADVALLQEAGSPPNDVAGRIDTGPEEHWNSHLWNSDWYQDRSEPPYDRWPMVVKLSDRVEVEWFKQVGPTKEVREDEIAVSGIGTVAAARVTPKAGDTPPFIVFSMYARWIRPHPSTRSTWGVGFPDGSAHRIISDLSAFIGNVKPETHRLLAAGDLNVGFGYTHYPQWNVARDQTVLDRMDALGLEYLGPHFPHGRRAETATPGLPNDAPNTPTYHSTHRTPKTANIQLDHAFASRGFHQGINVRAMNAVEEWGASDHCRLLIEVAS